MIPGIVIPYVCSISYVCAGKKTGPGRLRALQACVARFQTPVPLNLANEKSLQVRNRSVDAHSSRKAWADRLPGQGSRIKPGQGSRAFQLNEKPNQKEHRAQIKKHMTRKTRKMIECVDLTRQSFHQNGRVLSAQSNKRAKLTLAAGAGSVNR